MKKFIGILILASVTILGNGCAKEWLEPEQLSSLSPENTYSTVAGMRGLINELSKGLREEFFGSSTHMRVTYGSSDLAVHVNGSPRDYIGNVNPTDGRAKEHWDYFYSQVSYATTLLSRVDNINGSQEEKDEIKATGNFFLGYWYYRLITTFGDAVLKVDEDTSPKLDYQTSTQRLILATIIPKLEFAVQHLPENVAVGQVNRAAGYMILTKYYLMNGQFEDALSASSEVVSASGLSLMTSRFGALVGNDNPKIPNPNVMTDLFYKYNPSDPSNTEKILVIQDSPGIAGSTTGCDWMREHLTEWYRNHLDSDEGTSFLGTGSGKGTTIDGGTGGYGPLGEAADIQILWTGRGIGASKKTDYFANKVWSDPAFINDMRHTAPNWYPVEYLIANAPDRTINANLNKAFCADTLRSWDDIVYNKIVVDDENRLPDVYNMRGGNRDWYVYRLAEAHLMRAEALVWLNRNGEALEDLNIIRERAGALPMSGTPTLDDVLDERARELYLEEFRKNELVRMAYIMATQGRDGYSLANIGTNNWFYDRFVIKNNIYFDSSGGSRGFEYRNQVYQIEPYHIYFPIPESAINDNNLGQINQNFGYVGYEQNIPPLDI